MRRNSCFILFGLLISVFHGNSSACEVPVFRYALERWPTERYVLEYDSASGLSPQNKSVVAFLDSSAADWVLDSGASIILELDNIIGNQRSPCCL